MAKIITSKIFFCTISMVLVFYCVCSAQIKQVPASASHVYLQGTQLMVQKRLPNGALDTAQPYRIQGLTWTPATRAPVFGPDPLEPDENVEYGFFFDWPNRVPQGHELFRVWYQSQFRTHYRKDIGLMRQMNVRTIRTYSSFGDDLQLTRQILDECYRNNIMVIMTVAISKADIESGYFLEVVSRCKDHPAILMWSIGNEWNLEYNKYWGYRTITQAAAATNMVVQAIKEIDTNHPVSSCLGDRFSDKKMVNTVAWIIKICPTVDVWGFNIYRGRTFGDFFEQWKALSGKPCYISEFGTDSFRTASFKPAAGIQADDCQGYEDQTMQAEFVLGLCRELESELSARDTQKQCLGGLVHEFNDSLWKVGSYHAGLGGLVDYSAASRNDFARYNTEGFYLPGSHPDDVANEEYFGVVDADRRPKEVFWKLKEYYSR